MLARRSMAFSHGLSACGSFVALAGIAEVTCGGTTSSVGDTQCALSEQRCGLSDLQGGKPFEERPAPWAVEFHAAENANGRVVRDAGSSQEL